jgi:hypothetical protein
VTSTRKLVDSDDEQQVLEGLIDTAKPPWPTGRRFVGLHYLLATPFRHPPLRYGSRFGTRRERGIFYCAEEQATVLAEKAYYVLLFLEGTEAHGLSGSRFEQEGCGPDAGAIRCARRAHLVAHELP